MTLLYTLKLRRPYNNSLQLIKLTTRPQVLIGRHIKPPFRGTLIQVASRKKRDDAQKIQQQEDELHKIVQEQKSNPHLDLRHKIDTARTALNLSLTTIAEKFLRWSRHRYYTKGDKPTTL